MSTGVDLVVRVIRDKPGYFALKMQKAMKGLGTDDQALVRIIISRSECDMVQIKKSFEQQFQGRLADWIKVTSSRYFKSLGLIEAVVLIVGLFDAMCYRCDHLEMQLIISFLDIMLRCCVIVSHYSTISF